MNPVALIDPDILLVFAAVTSSFLLGCVHRLVRGLGQQRWEVANTGADLRDLVDRCDQQQTKVKRMQEEMQKLRSELQVRPEPVPDVLTRRPRTAVQVAPSRTPPKVDPLKLARAGAGVETLMSKCRLSRAEAELVFSVHGAVGARAA